MKKYFFHTLAVFGLILLFFGSIVAIVGVTAHAFSAGALIMLLIGLLEAFAGWKLLRFLTRREDNLSNSFFKLLNRIKPY